MYYPYNANYEIFYIMPYVIISVKYLHNTNIYLLSDLIRDIVCCKPNDIQISVYYMVHVQFCHENPDFWCWAIQLRLDRARDASPRRRRYLVFLYGPCHIYCIKVRVFICSKSAFFRAPQCNKCRRDVIIGPLRIKGLTACDDWIKKPLQYFCFFK